MYRLREKREREREREKEATEKDLVRYKRESKTERYTDK
jgi:hypothetical protein